MSLPIYELIEMSNMPTTTGDSFAFSNQANTLVTQSNTSIGSPSPTTSSKSKSLLPALPPKANPDDLAEYINEKNERVGAIIYIRNKNSEITSMTNKFYLTQMSIQHKERVQLMEAFDSANISFFGHAVVVYEFAGVAVDWASQDKSNKYQYFHQSSLLTLYKDSLRGSRLLEKDSIAVLKVYNHTIVGYPLNFNVVYNANNDKFAQFSMSWVITDHSLAMPEVVTTENLKNMTLPSTPNVKAIQETIKIVDDVITFNNWTEGPIKKAIRQLGTPTLYGASFAQFASMPTDSKKSITSTLFAKMQTLGKHINQLLSDKGKDPKNAQAFSLIKIYFGPSSDDVTKKFDTATISVLDSADSANASSAFDFVVGFMSELIEFKNDLLIFQSRMVG